jgi:hypothetical protein
MQFTSIVVDGVGKFGTRTEVTGLGPGVNILAAGNEAGKSTLFRAVRACLFERHTTKNDSVRNLSTDGLSLPVTVKLDFEHDGQAYTVTKSFVKSPAASLMRAGVEIARGREADEMLWELLGITPGSGRSVDEAAFGILWVGQGQSFKAPEPTEAATNVLNSAIQSEVGSLVGGERARLVVASLKDELSKLVTDKGKPKAGSPLADAMSRLEALRRDLADGDVRLSILDTQLVELGSKRSERTRLADPALISEMGTEVGAAQRSLKEGEGAAALLAQFESAEKSSKAALERVDSQLNSLLERRARIDRDRARDKELRAALIPIDAQEQAAREIISGARASIAQLDAQAEKDEAAERSLQQLDAVVLRANGRPGLLRRRDELIELSERLVRNAAGLANNRATAAQLASLNELEQEISVLTARLEASAPEVAVELAPSGVGKVSIGDLLLSAGTVQAAIDPVTILVADLVKITVTPPKSAGKADQKKREEAHKRLLKLIEDAGVSTASELRATRARREALEGEALALRAELKLFQITDPSPALAIDKLNTEIAAIDALVAEALANMEADRLPSIEEIAGRTENLRSNREQARRRRQGMDGSIDAQGTILSQLADTRGRTDGALTEIRNRLEADLAILPDTDRDSLVAAAEAAVRTASGDYQLKAAALEEQRQKAPSAEELERRQNRVARLQTALENQKTRLGSLDREIANLEGQIQSAGGDGLGEKIEELRQARELAEREVNKHKERVETLTLLKETIETCYTEQRDRLNAPLRRHLQPLLNDVFPAAELELGDGFSIAGIKRNGPGTENFDRLSAGTQEQIAVLVRLAMGAMICDRGQPVPIILDDALVFSDDDRIERMFDALNRAASKQQVIVLTCRLRAFAKLGGRQLSISV